MYIIETTRILHVYVQLQPRTTVTYMFIVGGNLYSKRLEVSLEVGHLEGPGVEKLPIGNDGELDMQAIAGHAKVQRLVPEAQEKNLGVQRGYCTLQNKVRACGEGDREGERQRTCIHAMVGQLVKHTQVYTAVEEGHLELGQQMLWHRL